MKPLTGEIIRLMRKHADELYTDDIKNQIHHIELLNSLVKIAKDELK